MKKVMIMALTLVMFWGMSYHHASAAKSVTESEVSSQLNNFMKQYVGNKWTGSYMNATQCKGFATMIFDKIFDLGGKTIGTGSTIKNSTNWKLNDLNSTVNCLGTVYNAAESDYANLLKQAKPGDFLQTRRRSSGNPHSMIVVSVSDSQIEIFDCNSEGDLLVRHYYQSFSAFKSRNIGVSLYRSKHYNVNTILTLDKPFPSVSISGSDLTFQWNGSSGATYYWIDIFDKVTNKKVVGQWIDKNTTQYTISKMIPGNYYAYVYASNENETMTSDVINISNYEDVGTNFYAYIENTKAKTCFTNDNQNVSGRRYTGSDNQIWKFERNADGSYYLISLSDGCALEVLNWKDENAANVKVWTKTEGVGEKWYIVKNKLGNYSFKPQCALGRSVDLNEVSSIEGTNIHLWEADDWNSQNFEIKKVNVYDVKYDLNGGQGTVTNQHKIQGATLSLSSQKPTRSGYTFQGWSTSNTAMTATYQPGTSYTEDCSVTLYAVWRSEPVNLGDGFYAYIQNVKSGTVFTNDNQNVSGRKYTGQNNQVWKFERNNDGSYFIISLADQCALEVLNWKDENDANVKVWTKTSGAGENWYIEKNRLNGYNLKPLCALGRSADLNEASSAEGTNIHLWESNDWDSQNFQIIKVGVYNLDYNMNGGQGSISSQYKIQDQTLKLSTSIPIRTGYTFLGWSTNSTATSATYQPGGTYAANSNITLYAVWKKNSSDISGKVISYDIGKSDAVTIRLLNSTGTSEVRKVQCKAGTSAQMAYEMKDVQAGSYILEVSKEGHVTRTCEVTVGENSVTQDVKICLLGDVTGDGKVNTRDLNRLYAHVNGTNLLTGYEFVCGDVTGDGKINTRDLNRLYAHISETNLLW